MVDVYWFSLWLIQANEKGKQTGAVDRKNIDWGFRKRLSEIDEGVKCRQDCCEQCSSAEAMIDNKINIVLEFS